jgi:DnaK suppressor protein
VNPSSPDAEQARTRLETEKKRLESTLGEVEQDYRDTGAISPSGDAAADTTAADETRATRDGLKEQLDEVNAALKRIDDGTYGIDEVTGDPINPERLAAEPTARTNIDS